MARRVLFTSPVQPIGGVSPDVYTWDKPRRGPKLCLGFLDHPGLAFLGENLPVETLHYPSPDDFRRALAAPPDVLGISFYINETETALAMAAEARRNGVREIWAGNFGAFSPAVSGAFDRVFTGWAEGQVAAALGAEPPSPLRHPEIYNATGFTGFPRMWISGVLFTSRGCPFTCNFCQTPDFYGRAQPLELAEIDRVVRAYKRRGVAGINILDENFGTFPGHAREVAEILGRHGMRWIALTRVDTLTRSFDHWRRHGLFGAHLGIESLNPASLAGAVKRIGDLASVELLRELGRHHMFVQVFYILGFEEDTPASIRDDVERLAGLDFDLAQIQVLTPYPRTGQTASIEARHGIAERRPSRYNSRNLVWNHPHIRPDEMRRLQRWANRRIATPRRALRTAAKLTVFYGHRRPSLEGLEVLARQLGPRGGALHRAKAVQLAALRRWSRTGWYAYEEEASDARAAVAAGGGPALEPQRGLGAFP